MKNLTFKDPQITKQQAIDAAGNACRLSKLLGVSRSTVHDWKTLPLHHAYRLAQVFPELNK